MLYCWGALPWIFGTGVWPAIQKLTTQKGVKKISKQAKSQPDLY